MCFCRKNFFGRVVRMESERLSQLLRPYMQLPLEADMARALGLYLDLLLRWNAKLNLTAVRDADRIVQRHFGESVFAAEQLLPASQQQGSVIDVGSGAGFPGLPLAMLRPQVNVALLEAHGKKATFLKEVVRTLKLTNVDVFFERAEQIQQQASLVTLRAVEKFSEVLPTAAALVANGGKLALLIGSAQIGSARELLPDWQFQPPVAIPHCESRVVLVGLRGREAS
jgi:16S rRNA (guanine527-N7)-methyltransferase